MPIALLNSVNPYRLEGQKTAAFEVVEQLGGVPDWVALPVGNGGNITAYWKGFGEIGAAPRMLAGQADGAAPLVHRAPVPNPETVATAIRIGNPARLDEALAALSTSPTAACARSTTRTSWLPTACWPRARACSASRPRRRPSRPCSRPSADGLVEPGTTVVCVLTGHGLKDPDTAGAEGAEILRCPPQIDRLEEIAFAAGAEPVVA